MKYLASVFFTLLTSCLLASSEGAPNNLVTFRQADGALEFAPFNGELTLKISVQFRTTDPEGVMFCGTADTGNYLIQIEIKNGNKIQFSYNFGDGTQVLEYSHNVTMNDDLWHTVHVQLDRDQILLRVDKYSESVSSVANFDVSQFQKLTVGASVDYSDGFVGCLGDLAVNDVLVDMQKTVRDNNTTYGVLEGCIKTSKCSSNPCYNKGKCLEGYSRYTCDCTATLYDGTFCSKEVGVTLSGGAYIRLDNVQNLLQRSLHVYNISLGFKTQRKSGIMLQISNERNTERISVEMNNYGGVKFLAEMEFERYEVNTLVHPNVDFSDDQTHEVVIRREENGGRIFIQVDNYDQVIVRLSDYIAPNTFPENPKYMYIGNNETGGGSKGFEGCLYRMQIDNFYILKTPFQDPRPNFVHMFSEDDVKEDECGIEEITHEPEPMVLRSYKPVCENLTSVGFGQDVIMSNETDLSFTISKGNNPLDSNTTGSLSIICSFNVTVAKLVYYFTVRRETSPGSGVFECIATLEAETTKAATLHDEISSKDGFDASGTVDTYASAGVFLRLDKATENVISSDVRNYTCEVAYKYSLRDTLKTSRSLAVVTDDMLDNLVTFTKDDATLEFAEFEGEQVDEVLFEFKTTASQGVLIHGTVGTKDDFIQVRVENGNRIEFLYRIGTRMSSLKNVDSIPNNNNWHVVHLKLSETSAWFRVDSSESVSSDLTGKVNFTKPVIVGAASGYSDGFVGCMKNLNINGVQVDMRKAVQDNQFIYGVAEGCVTKCGNNPCHNGGQCLEGYSHYTCVCTATPYSGTVCSREVGVKMEISYMIWLEEAWEPNPWTTFVNISFGFITRKKQGILLQWWDLQRRDYATIIVNNNGGIQFLLYHGGQFWQINSDGLNTPDLSDGQPHDVFLWFEQPDKIVHLKIDDLPLATARLQADSRLPTPNHMFIGNNDTTNYGNGFEGCIYRMQFNDFYPLKTALQTPSPSFVHLSPEVRIHEDTCGFEEIQPEPEPNELRPIKPVCGDMTFTDLDMEQQEERSAEELQHLSFVLSENNITLDSNTDDTLTMTCRINTTGAILIYYLLLRRETTPQSDMFECLAMVDAWSSKSATLYDSITNDRGFVVSGLIDLVNTSLTNLALRMDVNKLRDSDARKYMCEVAYKYSTSSPLKILRTSETLVLSSDTRGNSDKKSGDDEADDKPRTGLIVGVTLGVIVAVFIVIVVAWRYISRRRKMSGQGVLYTKTK